MRQDLLSVGIDIGTSTTQLVFSTLTLANQANAFSVPRISIAEKRIIYRSEIHFTPLLSERVIDAAAVREIVATEYQRAGIAREDVQTGAVIITGETARKENAREVLAALSDFAGDFVVATAGPDLESILAARGAGVDVRSKEERSRILHYDIGGGTSNLALYERGTLQETSCLDIGGRLVKVDPSSGRISYLSPPLVGRFSGVAVGELASSETLLPLAQEFTQAILQAAGLVPVSELLARYTTKNCKPLQAKDVQLSFSGGVADCIFKPQEELFLFGDMGPLLGACIREAVQACGASLLQGAETIRATVVGAGAHSLGLSGSTVYYRAMQFPLKNIPVLHLDEQDQQEGLAGRLQERLRWYADEEGLCQLAVALEGESSPSYARVERLAQELVEGLGPLMAKGFLPLVILQHDLAKVLGQAMAARLSGPLLCLDGLELSEGDYIDIAAPVAGGSVLPVVIKTLAFETS